MRVFPSFLDSTCRRRDCVTITVDARGDQADGSSSPWRAVHHSDFDRLRNARACNVKEVIVRAEPFGAIGQGNRVRSDCKARRELWRDSPVVLTDPKTTRAGIKARSSAFVTVERFICNQHPAPSECNGIANNSEQKINCSSFHWRFSRAE